MRSIGFALIMGITAAGGTCAQAESQYDFICTGSVSSSAANPNGTFTISPGPGPSPYTIKLHVDLTKKSFCEDDCRASQPLYSVGDDAIIFILSKGSASEQFWMARDLGTFFKVWTELGDTRKNEPNVFKSAKGQCILASLLPVPALAPSPSLPAPIAHDRSREISPPFDHTTKLKPQVDVQSSELGSEEISALVDVSNHHPIQQRLTARLHALGYVVWSDDVLKLTEKGRNLVGGE